MSKLSEASFLRKVFQTIDQNQKLCIVLLKEVYVKKTMLFHGGTVFGKAVNYPEKLANTVLSIMVVCLYGGPCFL